MIAAALLLLALPAGEPTVPLVVMAGATAGQLRALDGERRPFRIALASVGDQEGSRIVYEVKGPEGVEATAWLRGEPGTDELVVWGRLAEIRHKASGPFPAFTEYRVYEE